MRLFCLFAAVFALIWGNEASSATVMMEDMTWQEVDAAIKSGITTVIVPTGGIEQTGPHIVLGKHNFILHKTAPAIAEKLGHTLVAPIMPYVPEGDFYPPTGHMRFAGTISFPHEHFSAFLEDVARSLKQHGFKYICFVGEHGASQTAQAEVAAKLSEEWKDQGVKVIQVNEYYDEHNGQVAWMQQQDSKEINIEAHGGLADTSEMLVADPDGVRNALRGPYTVFDMDKIGANGSSVNASAAYGKKLLELKIMGAVNQIKRERGF